MTNRSGGERGKENPKKGKSKCLAPGKLIDNRNSMYQKNSTFVQSSQATTTPTPPTRTPLSAPTPSLAPTPSVASTPSPAPNPSLAPTPSVALNPSPALNPLPVQAAPVPRTAPILRTAPVSQAVPPLQTTLSSAPNHVSTSEVFRFMPTLGLNIQNVAVPLDNASREIPMEVNEEEIEDEDADEVVVGEGNVPPHMIIRDDNGKVIIQTCGSGLVPAKEVANAIMRYANNFIGVSIIGQQFPIMSKKNGLLFLRTRFHGILNMRCLSRKSFIQRQSFD